MPFTDVGNQSTPIPGSPLRRRRPLEQPDPARQQAFVQEGLRRRSALSARGFPGIGGYSPLRQRAFAAEGQRRRAAMGAAGVPGIPAPTLGGMANVPAGGVQPVRMPTVPQSPSQGGVQPAPMPTLTDQGWRWNGDPNSPVNMRPYNQGLAAAPTAPFAPPPTMTPQPGLRPMPQLRPQTPLRGIPTGPVPFSGASPVMPAPERQVPQRHLPIIPQNGFTPTPLQRPSVYPGSQGVTAQDLHPFASQPWAREPAPKMELMPDNVPGLRDAQRQRIGLERLSDNLERQLKDIQSRPQSFDELQAQQNAAGRAAASMPTHYPVPQSPIGPLRASSAMLRANEALNGNMPVRVPLEQQAFVDSQNRFQQPVAPVTFAPPQPGQIRPGNPWFDNAPQLRAAGNEYGLTRVPSDAVATPEQAAGMSNGTLAKYGNSTLRRVNGKNVLVGNKAALIADSTGGTSGAIRRAQDKLAERGPDGNLLNQQFAANVEYLRKQRAPKLAKESALRQAATDRKLLAMGSPPMKSKDGVPVGGLQMWRRPGQAHPGPELPAKPTGNQVVDDATVQRQRNEGAADLRATKDVQPTYAKLGLNTDDLSKAKSWDVLKALDNVPDAGLSGEEHAVLQQSVADYMKANPRNTFSDPEFYDEMQAIAKGESKKAKELQAKRQAKAKRNKQTADELFSNFGR